MSAVRGLVSLLSVLFLVGPVHSLNSNPLVILISFDGFRFDLLNETMVPHIHKWATENAWFVNGSQSQYVSFTAPNHMSIATGLYEESHGIVSNYFYDAKDDKAFDYFNYTNRPVVHNSSLDERWYLGEPIWLTNERADGSSRRSGVYHWPMGEANYPSSPHKPSFVRSWNQTGNLKSWINDVDTIVELFTREKDPVNFVSWYVAEPDTVLHKNGFYNGEFKKTITDLDKLFDYFMSRIVDFDLDKRLNIILTADHGHAEIKNYKSVLCLRDYVLGEGFEMGDHMIYPLDDNHAQAIFANLSRAVADGHDVEVMWKKDIPESWHYSNSTRVGQIVVNPRIGSSISFSCNSSAMDSLFGVNGTMTFNSSTHGMDTRRPEMRALLVMGGPAFAKKKQITSIPKNVDLYKMMCYILRINAAPNNGSMNVLQEAMLSVDNILKGNMHSKVYDVFTDTLGFFVIVLPSICIVMLFFIYGCRRTVLKEDPNWARPEAVRGYSRLSTGDGGEESVRMTRREQTAEGGGGRGVETQREAYLLHDLSSEGEDEL